MSNDLRSAALDQPRRVNRGRVLIIAGSDSGGGAGVQADIKTVTVLGGFATTAITAVTVQNTLGVSEVYPIPARIVAGQARAVLDDIGTDAIKTGMLGDAEIVRIVASLLDGVEVPVVVDPVMVAKGGASLLPAEAVDAVRALLVPRAALLTPNAPEAEVLAGVSVVCTDDLRRAGEVLLRLGARAVLMKGGHLEGEMVTDVFMTSDGEAAFQSRRILGRHTHGTGCTLASACALYLANGLSTYDAVAKGHTFVQGAIQHARGFGGGHGPVDHGWSVRINEAPPESDFVGVRT